MGTWNLSSRFSPSRNSPTIWECPLPPSTGGVAAMKAHPDSASVDICASDGVMSRNGSTASSRISGGDQLSARACTFGGWSHLRADSRRRLNDARKACGAQRDQPLRSY